MLSLLNHQDGIEDVHVVVADISDDGITKEKLKRRKGDKFKLRIVQGGLPGVGRNNGSKVVTTPYILFMDSDIFILDTKLITESLDVMIRDGLDLLTTKVRTTNGKYNYVFRVFDYIQKMVTPFGPFCLGGFMMFNKETFDRFGGFDEKVLVAEDYLLSKRVNGKKFRVMEKMVFTTPRRFDDKGLWYMIRLMVSSFIHRGNKNFFMGFKTYWR